MPDIKWTPEERLWVIAAMGEKRVFLVPAEPAKILRALEACWAVASFPNPTSHGSQGCIEKVLGDTIENVLAKMPEVNDA